MPWRKCARGRSLHAVKRCRRAASAGGSTGAWCAARASAQMVAGVAIGMWLRLKARGARDVRLQVRVGRAVVFLLPHRQARQACDPKRSLQASRQCCLLNPRRWCPCCMFGREIITCVEDIKHSKPVWQGGCGFTQVHGEGGVPRDDVAKEKQCDTKHGMQRSG